jgi:hypothetical protein
LFSHKFQKRTTAAPRYMPAGHRKTVTQRHASRERVLTR